MTPEAKKLADEIAADIDALSERVEQMINEQKEKTDERNLETSH